MVMMSCLGRYLQLLCTQRWWICPSNYRMSVHSLSVLLLLVLLLFFYVYTIFRPLLSSGSSRNLFSFNLGSPLWSIHVSVQLWTDASNVVASLVIILVVWLPICVVKSKLSYHCCHHPFGLWNEPSSTKLYYQREQTVAQASAEASKGLVTTVTDLGKRGEVVSEWH